MLMLETNTIFLKPGTGRVSGDRNACSRYVFAYECLRVLMVWSWGGEKSLLAKLEESKSFRAQSLLEQVLPRMGDVGSGDDRGGRRGCSGGGMCPHSYSKMSQMEGQFQKPPLSQKQQGREEHLGFLIGECRVSKIAFGCRRERDQKGSQLLSAAEHSLKTPSPSPTAQERGDEAVLNPQRYRPVRSPVPHLLLHPSLADSPGPWSHPRGTRLARAEHVPTVG